jgi:hypothetical protein
MLNTEDQELLPVEDTFTNVVATEESDDDDNFDEVGFEILMLKKRMNELELRVSELEGYEEDEYDDEDEEEEEDSE